jgi:hypothetical protein
MGGFRANLTMRPKHATRLLGPLTVNTTSVGIPSTWIGNGDSSVLISNNGTGDVLFGIGTDPTTANLGIRLVAGQSYLIDNCPEDISRLRFLRIGSNDGSLSFQFFTE